MAYTDRQMEALINLTKARQKLAQVVDLLNTAGDDIRQAKNELSDYLHRQVELDDYSEDVLDLTMQSDEVQAGIRRMITDIKKEGEE